MTTSSNKDKGVKKECNHKWQIVYCGTFTLSDGGGGNLIAVCTKCFEKKDI
jgi:hypothetical protein